MLQTLRSSSSLARTLAPSARVASAASSRGYATSSAVDLTFDVFEPKELKNADQSLVLCHGLFGSKQNFRSLARGFAQRLGMPVYSLDMRNHGASPHVKPHEYSVMAQDIAMFLDKQNINGGVNLLGHSMGGKAVQAFALNKELNGPLRSLIAIDMSPAVGKVSPAFMAYIDAMREVESAKVTSRAEADELLKKVEPNLATRQFLLTNVTNSQDGNLVFRMPLDLLADEVPEIGGFPYSPPPPVTAESPQWEGPTLFIKGKNSPYINRKNIPVCEAYFPNMQLVTIDAGHWVQVEQPAQTTDTVTAFINGERVDNREKQ